jgi:hypothetical protein
LDENNYFVWDISSFHSEEHVLNKKIWGSMISFNGNIVNALGDELFFISKDSIQSYPLPDEPLAKENLYIAYEFPKIDGRILISEYGEIDNYEEGVGFTDTFYAFDPESRKISVHQLFLPNLYKMVNRYPFAQYSPSMKYALYESSPDEDNHRRYTLYDIENEKILMVIPPQDSNLAIIDDNPQWLPNTDMITAEFYDRKIEKYDQYLVSLDGTISPITNLLDDVGISTRYFSGGHYWSPGNRYFALLDFNLFLYLWDKQTETLYKPCLPNENNIISAPQLTWAPNGNYVVVTLIFPSPSTPIVDPSGQIIEQQTVSKYILDLPNKTIYSLPNDVNEREYPQSFTNGHYQYIGWVNWEIP